MVLCKNDLKNLFIKGIIYIRENICPDGPMDRIVDSGSTGVGSIPTRDTITQAQAGLPACVLIYLRYFGAGFGEYLLRC